MLVVTGGHGAELLELADAALDDVALLYHPASKGWWAASRPAAVAAVGFVVFLDGGITALMPCRRSQARLPTEEYAWSPIARPGRHRALPRLLRRMRIASVRDGPRGVTVLAGLVSRAMGRQRRSAAG